MKRAKPKLLNASLVFLFLFSTSLYFACQNDESSRKSEELERERLALEREKLQLEKERMELERQKRQGAVESERRYQDYEREKARSSSSRYYVAMDQIDDVGSIYLNGDLTASCEWRGGLFGGVDGSISPIDITSQLREGRNTIRFELYNKEWQGPGGKYSYHFKLYKTSDYGGTEVLFERQGTRADKAAGSKFDESCSFYKE